MNFYSILLLISFFTAFFTGVFVYSKNQSMTLNKIFLIYSLAVISNLLGAYEHLVVSDPAVKEFWLLIRRCLWPIIYASQLHLVITYVDPVKKISKVWLYFIWIPVPFLLFLTIAGLYDLNFPGINPQTDSLIRVIILQIYTYATSLAIIIIGLTYISRVKNKIKRVRMLFLLAGLMFPTFGAILTYNYFPNSFMVNVMPFIVFSAWVFMLVGIVQFRLFDITPGYAADSIISIMKEALLLIDNKGTILKANNAFYLMTGLTDNFTASNDIQGFFKLCDFNHLNISKVFFENELTNKQFIFNSASGKNIEMLFSSSFLRKPNGMIRGSVCVIADISDLSEAREELRTKHLEMLKMAHQAGMAEVATDVMHNIGNVLTSISVSTEKTDEILKKSKLKSLADANKLLASYAENLSSFLQTDSKGKLLIDYYSKIRDYLDREHMQLEEENKILLRKFNLIKNTIEMQQDHARADFYVESVDMEELLDEVMMVIEDFILRNGITVRKKILSQKEVFSTSQRSKLFNIMLNLVKNAAESVLSNEPDNRFIDIAMNYCDDNVVINIADNGSGITQEEMPHLFEYGFTTKENGNGFGLHFCSNTLREMMGSLSVKSEGRGKGAEFTITIPRAVS